MRLESLLDCPLPSESGMTAREVLSGPSTSIKAICRLREHAKHLARVLGAPDDHAAAVAVYFAAIARAKVASGETITSHSPAYLVNAMGQLMDQPWMPDGLRSLLRGARDAWLSEGASAAGRLDAPGYGGFAITGEFGRSGLLCLYSARHPVQPKGRYLVKVFQPPMFWIQADRPETYLQTFLDRVDAHHRVCESGAEHWVPLHASGKAEGAGFAAMDAYDRSAESLMLTKVRMRAGLLREIVLGVLDGLMEARAALGRPHGAVKPSNVLLRDRRWGHMEVGLADPAPAAWLADVSDAVEREATDLAALGRLIYGLILHRLPVGAGLVQAGESGEWQVLGRKAGARWRDLCNRLLRTQAGVDVCPLEAIREQAAGMRQ